jgi:hypothetical protein
MPIAQSTRSSGAICAIGLPAPTAAGYPLSHKLTDFHFAHLATTSLPGMSFMYMRKVCEVKLGALLRCVMTLARGRLTRRQAPPTAGCLNCHPGAPERERSPRALDTTRSLSATTRSGVVNGDKPSRTVPPYLARSATGTRHCHYKRP